MTYFPEVPIEDINDRFCIPPRSRLFGLKAINVGSFKSEGLISYVIRLANAHCISPRLLISDLFLPSMRNVSSVSHSEFHISCARTLHGTGKFADKFSSTAEDLTGQINLGLTTALPWRNVVPSIGTGLMAKHPKWCNACMAEHRSNNEAAYFRLSWGFALYQVCSQHQTQLVDECPWCGKHQPFIPSHADIGRCNYCYGWLGTYATQELRITDSQNIWISNAIEDMIIHNQTAYNIVTGELFRNRLMDLAKSLANGEKTTLSLMLGLSESTMNTWITKKQKPLFPQFLYFCHQLDLLPSEFLLSEFNPQELKLNIKPMVYKSHHIQPRIGLQEPPQADIYIRLKTICNDANDCRPLTSITADLSLTRKYLIYWFPTECNLISLKYKRSVSQLAAHRRKDQMFNVRNIIWHMHSKGLYPSNRKVAAVIAPLKLSLLRKHIRLTHRKTLKELML